MRRPANSMTGTDGCALCALRGVVVCGDEGELCVIAGALLAGMLGTLLGVTAVKALCSMSGRTSWMACVWSCSKEFVYPLTFLQACDVGCPTQ